MAPGCSMVADAGNHHVPVKTVKTMKTEPMPRQVRESTTSCPAPCPVRVLWS